MSQQSHPGTYGQVPGQPPYGGYSQGPHGPQYPYNPPPQKRKRHLVRNIFLGIFGLVVAIIVISVATSGGTGVSTTPSGGSSTQTQDSTGTTNAAAPAGLGSYFNVKDGSGDTYRVTLAKIIDRAQGADQFTTPDHGNRFVGVVFTITALSGSPQDEDANNDAAVIGSNGQIYTPDISSITGYTNFTNGQINVAQGEKVKGAVTFQLPIGVKVTRVQWSAASGFGSTVQWNVP